MMAMILQKTVMVSKLLFKQLQIMYKRERQQGVKVYFRNCLKYAKIAYFISPTPSNTLYQYAKQIYGLRHQKIHLFHKGKMLLHTDNIELQENAIIHIVYLQELKKDKIKIKIKQTKASLPPLKFEIPSDTTVKQFIDHQLYEAYGQKSEEIFLVHLGKQLSLQCTFREEQVEDGAELLCVDFRNNPQSPKNTIQKQQQTYVIKLPIKQLQAPSPPKDIYPHQKFQIGVPVGLQTSNTLHLIFDSKIKHSSSIGNIDLDPSQVIPQQDSHFSLDINKNNTSSQSQILVKEGGQGINESMYSERVRGRDGQEEQVEFQKVRIQEKGELDEANLCGGDLIYAGNINCLHSTNVMHDILNDYAHKIIDLSKKAGRSAIN